MLRHVALVTTDVQEELRASGIRVKGIDELGTTLAVTSNRHTLRANTNALVFARSVCRLLVTASVILSSPILVTLLKEALSSSWTSVVTRATRRNIPGNDILQLLSSIISSEHSAWSRETLGSRDIKRRWPLIPVKILTYFAVILKKTSEICWKKS
jgi:hypothetical protein